MQHIAIYRLRNKHRLLDAELRRELARPAPDDARIGDLKRRKLLVKDQLARLERSVQRPFGGGDPQWT